MSTLIYSPQISIRIRASALKNSVIDVSDDIMQATIVRNLAPSLSTVNFTLLNNGRKYDDVFETMDAIVVYLRRLRTMLSFTGYLDVSPKFAALPGSVNLASSCTLKRLQYFYWDPGTQAALDLEKQAEGLMNEQDGGLAVKARDLLTDVAGWSKEQIHISTIPSNWFDKVGKLADTLAAESQAAQMAAEIGSQSYINGTNPMEINGAGPTTGGIQNDADIPLGPTTIQGIGPGTGALPATVGKCSSFGGPHGGAYGNFALTGEPGTHPANPWYCAMRWPYVNSNAVPGAKTWWRNRKILVVNPKNNRAVCVRAADWGPADWTGRVIDLGPGAISAIGAVTDDTVHIGFANAATPLGPVHAPASGGPTLPASPSGGNGSFSGASSSGWGPAGSSANERTVSAAGLTFTVNKLAVSKFTGFVSDLVSTFGYHPSSIGGFNDRPNTSNPAVKSAHAYGAAIDIDPPRNPRYTSPPWGSYALPHDTKALVALCRKWGVGWGGEWIHTKDYMHFEIIGAPGTAPNYGQAPSINAAVQGGTGTWLPPVKAHYVVTAHFGDGGTLWSAGHTGTDFACPTGTPIFPVGPGVIHDKGTGDPDYGNHVSIDHGSGVYTYYAHMLHESPLSIGQPVDRNTQIGQVDTTGNATGPHVHVELRLGADTYDAAKASGGIEKYILGANPAPPPRGVPGADGTTADPTSLGDTTGTGGGASGPDLSNIGGGLFNVWQWSESAADINSMLLADHRALMNDVPIMGAVSDLMTAGQRDFCSAPNGDFIGWFPDYYGFYGQAGKIVISPLEISADTPPTIFHADAALKTHQFVTGATSGTTNDASSIFRMMETAGIVSVEDPAVLEALLNVSTKEAEAISATYLNRYGARPESTAVNTISGPRQEFYFACMNFIRNWSEQFQTTIAVTFMPEAYPGMLACFPYYGIQGYIRSVTHSIDLANGGGFQTQISAAPWSSIGGKGPKGLPRGGAL